MDVLINEMIISVAYQTIVTHTHTHTQREREREREREGGRDFVFSCRRK